MTIRIMFHSADHDGKGSAAILRHMFQDALLYPMNYGEAFPWDDIESDDEVYMVDFSLEPFDDMIKLNKMCRFTWIDHHISAIDKYVTSRETISGNRSTTKAACILTWEYIYPERKVPSAIAMLGRYDVFDLDERVLTFEYGMRAEDADPARCAFWKSLIEDDQFEIDRILHAGKSVKKYIDQYNAISVKTLAHPVTFEGLPVLAINHPRMSSLAFNEVKSDKYHALICYHSDGQMWKFAIYSNKEGLDVSKLAQKYGGGGHSKASGFACNKLPF